MVSGRRSNRSDNFALDLGVWYIVSVDHSAREDSMLLAHSPARRPSTAGPGSVSPQRTRTNPLGRLLERLEDRTVPTTVTFDFTGGVQTWTVPAGVTSAVFDVYGAQGSGFGGRATATLPVTGGEVLAVYVGGMPSGTTGGFNGGGNAGSSISPGTGGGGGSDVRRDADSDTVYELTERILVAGGGGGAGGFGGGGGGGGGGLSGSNGGTRSFGIAGAGGTQTAAGAAAGTTAAAAAVTAYAVPAAAAGAGSAPPAPPSPTATGPEAVAF